MSEWLSEDERRWFDEGNDVSQAYTLAHVHQLCVRLAAERQKNSELRAHIQKQEQRYLAALADSDNELAAERQKVAELVEALTKQLDASPCFPRSCYCGQCDNTRAVLAKYQPTGT